MFIEGCLNFIIRNGDIATENIPVKPGLRLE
jgi:hypothetical protein